MSRIWHYGKRLVINGFMARVRFDAASDAAAAAGAGAGAAAAPGKAGGADAGKGAPAAQTPTFSIPKEYENKGWTSKVKSQEDLFKLLDNLDGLAGKKMVVPDLEKGDPKEVNAYLASLRGDTKIEDYVFPDGSDKEITSKIAKVIFDAGLPKSLANKLISGYSAVEKEIVSAKHSAEGMEAMLKTSFGDGYKEVAGQTANFLKNSLSAEDQKLLEKIPNDHLGIIYRLANNVIKAYGIKEGDKAIGGGEGGAGAGDIEAQKKSVRAQITALSKRPHTAAEKKVLVDKLDALTRAK